MDKFISWAVSPILTVMFVAVYFSAAMWASAGNGFTKFDVFVAIILPFPVDWFWLFVVSLGGA